MSSNVGPHPGAIKVSSLYYYEHLIRRKLYQSGVDSAREEEARLRGIQLIYELKQELLLPVKTYNTACVFYHRFRLKHIGDPHNWRDVAITCLFVACKAEDTLKKSREILCANYNMKNTDQKIPDDKCFDNGHKLIVGLERLVIESVHFDFRVRNPQDILAKVVKKVLPDLEEGRQFFVAAFQVSLDMYRTYAPIKQTSHTMALALCELTALLFGWHVEKFRSLDPAAHYTDRGSITETMLDILDLYENYQYLNEFAKQFPLETFINIKIVVNKELEEKKLPRYKFQCAECEKNPEPVSDSDDPDFVASTTSSTTSTRYIFDAEQAAAEVEVVHEYFNDDYELIEVEEEEDIPDSPPPAPLREQHRGPRGPRNPGGSRGRRGPGGGPPRGPGGPTGALAEPFQQRGGPPRGPGGSGGSGGGGRDHGPGPNSGSGGRGGSHNGNWRPRNRHGNRRRRD